MSDAIRPANGGIRRYAVFLYDKYYPCGGWNDFACSFDTQEEAVTYAKSKNGDYKDVIDLQTGKEAWSEYRR